MTPRPPTGPRFTPRELPAADVAAMVTEGTGAAVWRYRFKIMLHASADEVAAKLPPPVRLEPVGDHRCIMHAGSDTLDLAAVYIGMLDVEFDVIEPPELIDRMRHLATRYLRAAGDRSASELGLDSS